MTDETRMTAVDASVGADDGRSLNVCTGCSITEDDEEIKSFEEMQRELLRMADPSYLKTVSMTELFDNVYQSRPPIIDGLLYRGMYLFVGAPKMGKSFLMGQIAYHVSTGTPLWGFPVRQGTVLYLALEDDYGRLQERLYRMFGTAENENLFFSVSAKQLGKGLDEQLTRFLREHPDTSMIIIDTLQKVREVGGDNYSYANDYQIITRLKTFADTYGICLMVVHHTRKQKADDAFDMISGTNGLMGAADGAFLLQKEKRTSNAATLEVSGRDQQDQRLYLLRNEEKLCWDLDRIETRLWEAPPEPLLEEVAKRITADCPEWSGSPTELCGFLGVDMKANALTQKLNVNAGRLLQEYRIQYWNKRSHAGRQVGLRLAQRDDA
ncbi:MAG: AAA family ATPase [Oscillospiraceae bacterium]|nr:AAA family ATPase [Oscillospiraceae bacterium]